MGLKNIFGQPEKPLEEKKLEVIASAESLRDKRIADLLALGKTFFSEKIDRYGDCVGVADALRQALDYAGKDGFVASMPEMIAAKVKVDKSHEFWQKWYAFYSEEDMGIDKKGLFGKKGEAVLVVVHGGGILTPDRIEKAYAEGLVDSSAKYRNKEWGNLLEGRLPNGEAINLYSLDDLKKETPKISKFGVVMPYEVAQLTKSGWHTKKEFVENPLVIARNGGLENLEAYFDKAKNSDLMLANFHPFKSWNPNQTQGRLLFLNDCEGDLGGGCGLDYDGRFVGVSAGGT
ncbi:hypothetical protein HY643_00375 [Candidatus Woesearchaeota archaeon]|nr:hypothetical protein [Candidatus Woesearchaeota archaeon]